MLEGQRRRLFPAATMASSSSWPLWWAGAGWAAAVMLSGVCYAVAAGAGADPDGALSFTVGQTGLWVGFVAAATTASRRFGSGDLRRDFVFVVDRRDGIRAGVGGVVLQLVVVPAVYLPVVLLDLDLDISGPAEDLFASLSPIGTLVVVVGVVVAAPITEELLFRGVLLGALCERYSERGAVLISGAVFAGTHFQLIQFPALFVAGVAFSWLAVRSRGLGVPIVAHMAFNATTAVVLLAA